MDWVTQHLQLLIAIAGAVAWFLNQQKQKSAGTGAPPEGKSFEDPELAERTRRIREEIQRKIDQRVRSQTLSTPVAPPPVPREVVTQRPEPRPTRAAISQLEAQRTAEILAQQAALAEQLRLADEFKASVARRAQFQTEAAGKEEAAKTAVRSALGEDLRDPAALRRAFILREVLGPPVALRP